MIVAHWFAEAVWRWWWIDPYLQAAVLITSIVGCGFSIVAYCITRERGEVFRRANVNGERQSAVRLHLITHTGIGLSQGLLALVSVGALGLPAVPVSMYMDAQAHRVLAMLMVYKIARLITSLLLLWVSARTLQWLRS